MCCRRPGGCFIAHYRQQTSEEVSEPSETRPEVLSEPASPARHPVWGTTRAAAVDVHPPAAGGGGRARPVILQPCTTPPAAEPPLLLPEGCETTHQRGIRAAEKLPHFGGLGLLVPTVGSRQCIATWSEPTLPKQTHP